jgi:hypothetical protein
MILISSVAHFLLSEWLWAVTWGFYHIPLNSILLFIMLKALCRMKVLSAAFWALISQLFAFFAYTFIILGVIHPFFAFDTYSYDFHTYQTMHPVIICLSLGAVYSVFQIIFFYCVHRYNALNLSKVVIAILLSNMIAALFVSRYLPFY